MKRRDLLIAGAGIVAQGIGPGLIAHPRAAAEAARPGAGLRAGTGERSIVPDAKLVNNALHGMMAVRFDERGSELKVKGLALAAGDERCLLLAIDLVEVPTPHAERMREAVARATGLPPDSIVISASHSHSTPFLEPPDGPQPFFDFVVARVVEAAGDAVRSLRPATIGYGAANVVGASFNQRVPLPDGRVRFTRDFRAGLASGRPVDPRLSVVRIDGADGRPIAGWVRFAAHPACVIFDAPLSAEYPGYMTDALSRSLEGSPPVLFGYGASGDLNCVPMFGTEADSRRLGEQLAAAARSVFESIRTGPIGRLRIATKRIELPLDPPPTPEALDREIAEVERFIAQLDEQPDLEWVLGANCKPDWPADKKKRHAKPLADWARLAKRRLAAGGTFPKTWPRRVTALVLDDWALVFEAGETLVEVSLALSARSPLTETLLVSVTNGNDGYLGSDEDRQRGGYETFTSTRYKMMQDGFRPLPYATGAAERYIEELVELIRRL